MLPKNQYHPALEESAVIRVGCQYDAVRYVVVMKTDGWKRDGNMSKQELLPTMGASLFIR